MRRVAVVAFVVVMALGSSVGVGVAGAQTAPSPTDALCGEDPLAALPPEIAGPLAPLTGLLGQLATAVCSAIPEGGGLPGLPEGGLPGLPEGGLPGLPEGGGIPGLGDALAPLCGPLQEALGAVPAPLDALTTALGPVIGALCGDAAGSPAEPGELCVPLDMFLGAIPAELQEPLAPVTGLVEQLVGTFCGLLVGAPEGGGDEAPPAPEPALAVAGSEVSNTGVSAASGPELPRTGGTSAPLAAGAALAALAGGLRWGLRSRRG